MENVAMKPSTQHSDNDLRKARFHLKNGGGIEVREEELTSVTAQALYKMRCECGRSWFELELPQLVKCPACDKLGLVNR
jgi:hypothetical protein